MAKIDKLLNRWSENPPREENVDTVLAVLDRFFEGRYRKVSGSHIVVSHPDLAGKREYGPQGEFTIPVKGGQKVKGQYVRDLVEVILSLGLREEERKEREEKEGEGSQDLEG